MVSVLDSGAKGPGFKSQTRRCRVTVLGYLFTSIVPLFTAYRRVYDSRHLQAACCGGVRAAGRSYATTIIILNLHKILTLRTDTIIMPPPYSGHSGIAQSVRLTVPWRSCLGYTHAGCLQLSHRRPPEMCGLRTRPRTDVDPPRFLPPSNCEGISSCRARGDTLFKT